MRVRWGPMVGIRCQRCLSTETNIPELHFCSLLTEHSGNPLLFQQTTKRISWIVCFRLQNLMVKSVAFCWRLKKQDAIQNKHTRLVFRRHSRNTRRHTHGEVRFWWFSELFLGLCHDSGRDWKPCNWPLCYDKAASPALSLLLPWLCQRIQPRRTGGYVYASQIVLARSGWKVREGASWRQIKAEVWLSLAPRKVPWQPWTKAHY